MTILQKNKQTYNALADQYEQKVGLRKKFNASVIQRFAKFINTGKNVLDIGCAVGLDTSIFVELGFDVTGIEISDEMVRYAKLRNPNAEIINDDFLLHDFNKQYDAIFAQAYIHLYPKTEVGNIFQKIHNLLVDGGIAHITTSKSLISKEGWYQKMDYVDSPKRFRKFWTRKELEEALIQHKFKVVDYYEIADPYQKEWMVFTVRK